MTVSTKPAQRQRRHRRVRAKVRGSAERPRICVFRSNRGISAQLIDDDRGHTVAAATWTEDDIKGLARMEQAQKVGTRLAERAKAAGVDRAVFDRGGYRYHGRVKALADSAREAGLTV
ncbi:MAG TPA: 50S ribosomal protein L18 [Solirubrobacteraceae bacterium]|jgi:large subunit ribosomal protein L18|nr:50S ribosomal protein L18 [Solirubrobacteraceae bacterium]